MSEQIADIPVSGTNDDAPKPVSAIAAAMGSNPHVKEVDTIPDDVLTEAEDVAETLLGDDTGVELVGRDLVGDKLGPAVGAALDQVRRYAEAIVEVTIPEPTDDNPAATRTYRCFTLLTLKGKRKRFLASRIAGIVPMFGVVGGGLDMIQLVGMLLDAPTKDGGVGDFMLDLLGAAYVPVDGNDRFDPATVRELGERIDEELTMESYMGILYRFFSASGSGLEDGLKDSLRSLLTFLPTRK